MNTNVVFLAYFADPISSDNYNYCLLEKDQDPELDVNPDRLTSIKSHIITYDAWRLIDHLRLKGIRPPNSIIDICSVYQFSSGYPASDFGDRKPWDIENLLKTHINEDTLNEFQDLIWGNLEFDNSSPHELLVAVSISLVSIFEAVDQKVLDVYLRTEAPLANIFYRRQHEGIRVDAAGAEAFLRKLEDEYYLGVQRLRDCHKFLGGVFDYEYIHRFLMEKSDAYREHSHVYSVREFIDYFSDIDSFAELLRSLRRLHFAKSCALKVMGSEQERVYPFFDPVGTVTGRVMVVEPLLQHLRKKDRYFIQPDKGKRLLYLDYREFEPRILSALSGDPFLRSLVEKGRLYESISEQFFKGRLTRDKAKIVMMQLSYGASIESISRSVSIATDISYEDAMEATEGMFAAFSGLMDWKNSVVEEADKLRIIYAGHGIVRRFPIKKRFKEKMKRQAINHMIQATGSSILKAAILKIYKQFNMVDILLPMHDAILMQLPEDARQDDVDRITLCMVSAFSEKFDGLESVVVEKRYFE